MLERLAEIVGLPKMRPTSCEPSDQEKLRFTQSVHKAIEERGKYVKDEYDYVELLRILEDVFQTWALSTATRLSRIVQSLYLIDNGTSSGIIL